MITNEGRNDEKISTHMISPSEPKSLSVAVTRYSKVPTTVFSGIKRTMPVMVNWGEYSLTLLTLIMNVALLDRGGIP